MTFSTLSGNKLVGYSGMLLTGDITASTGSPTQGTFTDANGFSWKYYDFSTSGTITLARAGWIDLCVIGGGGGAQTSYSRTVGAGAGAVYRGMQYSASGTISITIGGGGASGANGASSSFGSVLVAGGGQKAIDFADIGVAAVGGGGSPGGQAAPGGGTGNVGGGAIGTPNIYTGISLNYTGSTIEYAQGGKNPAATTPGSGGWSNSAGTNGRVIVKVRN